MANKAAGPGEVQGYKGVEVDPPRAGFAAKSALGNGHEPFSPCERERGERDRGRENEREEERERNARSTDKIKTRWSPYESGRKKRRSGGGKEEDDERRRDGPTNFSHPV